MSDIMVMSLWKRLPSYLAARFGHQDMSDILPDVGNVLAEAACVFGWIRDRKVPVDEMKDWCICPCGRKHRAPSAVLARWNEQMLRPPARPLTVAD